MGLGCMVQGSRELGLRVLGVEVLVLRFTSLEFR